MHIAVCVKQIFDPEVASSLFRIDEQRLAVVPIPGLQLVMSPFDEQAVEAALRIREQSSADTRISLITLGPESSKDILKHGLSMGADEAFHIDDTGLVHRDGAVTAYLLARAVERCGDVQMVLAGRQSADLDAGVVGCAVADQLGMPVVNWARSIEVSEGCATVERVLDDGIETVTVELPSLITVSNELGTVRKPSLRETMRAARKPMETWTAADLGVADGGESLSRQSVERLYIPVKESRCSYIDGTTPRDMAASLVRELDAAKLL
jgi:electron transfer flavoprotein beta subunit